LDVTGSLGKKKLQLKLYLKTYGARSLVTGGR